MSRPHALKMLLTSLLRLGSTMLLVLMVATRILLEVPRVGRKSLGRVNLNVPAYGL